MRVGIYARVSTSDKDQNPETQLIRLQEFVQAQGWVLAGEYVDHASATDLRGRKDWRRLLDQAAKRHVDVILVFRMDRAFRSVLDAADTLERLRGWGVGLRSYGEPWLDTTSTFGEALYYITVAYAQLEKGILVERVKAGMARAKKQGRRLGRPRAVSGEWARVQPLIRQRADQPGRSRPASQGLPGHGLAPMQNGGRFRRPARPCNLRRAAPMRREILLKGERGVQMKLIMLGLVILALILVGVLAWGSFAGHHTCENRYPL